MVNGYEDMPLDYVADMLDDDLECNPDRVELYILMATTK